VASQLLTGYGQGDEAVMLFQEFIFMQYKATAGVICVQFTKKG
jgi:hypothetical protein